MELFIVIIIVGIAGAFVGRRIWRSLRPPAVRHGTGGPACRTCCDLCCGDKKPVSRDHGKSQ